VPYDQRLAVAEEALKSGVWFHTSHTYGETLGVLREAQDAIGLPTPPAIFKIGWSSVEEIRKVIGENLNPLGASKMAVGQLCLGGEVAEEFGTGACYEGLEAIRTEGLVDRYVLECWPWASKMPLEVMKSGLADDLLDGLIFYLNPLQRFVSDDLWDLIVEKQIPVVAMRTVCGGSLTGLIKRGEEQPSYLTERAKAMVPIFEESECESWPEFCVRFALSFPFVRATVGSSSRQTAFHQLVELAEDPKPLARDVVESVLTLHRKWAKEHDQFAEPWSM
jgi:hypothetical protein